MLTRRQYLEAYLRGLARGNYWPRVVGPILLVVGSYIPIDRFSAWRGELFWIGIIWLIFVTFWFPYDLLKSELDTRDADDQLKSHQARLERTYFKIGRLIEEGERRIKENAPPEVIRGWDESVKELLARRCTDACLQVYEGNTRIHGQVHLDNQPKAIAELRKMLIQLAVYVR